LNTSEKEEEMECDDWQWIARRQKGEVSRNRDSCHIKETEMTVCCHKSILVYST